MVTIARSWPLLPMAVLYVAWGLGGGVEPALSGLDAEERPGLVSAEYKTSVFSPIVMRGARREDLPTVAALPVRTAMGLGLDRERGKLTQPGRVFEFGPQFLCNLIAWHDLEIGTTLRWQWYVDGEPIEAEGLNGTLAAEERAGWRGGCIQNTDGSTGRLLPIPIGTYRVDVWLGDDAEPAASATAVFQEDPPPGATPIHPEPTVTPTPPGPTATPDPATYTCRELIVNGDFEAGPQSGWALVSNVIDEETGKPIGADLVILNNDAFETADPAYEGEWLAILGGGESFVMRLVQQEEVDLVDAASIVSATLRYHVGVVTAEEADQSDDDRFAVFVRSQAGETEQVPGTGISEETLEPGYWYDFTIDLTELMTGREGWEKMRLLLYSDNDLTEPTSHLVDEVSVSLCEWIDPPPSKTAPVRRLVAQDEP